MAAFSFSFPPSLPPNSPCAMQKEQSPGLAASEGLYR